MLLHVEVNGHTQVASQRHHRHRPQFLTKMYGCRTYTPVAQQAPYSFDDRVGSFDFNCVRRIFLMYNTKEQQFDKIKFVGDIGEVLSTLTLKTPIVTMYRPEMSIQIIQYQLAGIFVGDLDFLANFVGQQGASVKWPCLFCLACQDRLSDCFRLGSDAPRFGKRKGTNSIQNCFAIYKREYLDLPERRKNKSKKRKRYQGVIVENCWTPACRHPSRLYCISNNACHTRIHEENI